MIRKTTLLILTITCLCTFANGFVLLSHQAIIDAAWKTSIKPLLIKKYPGATEVQLKEAYSYLYKEAQMPDIGYSPFGSIMFTNLMHYLRSGDFVMTLSGEAKDIKEYALGLGFFCHNQADKYVHALGTNLAVPILLLKLKEEHVDTVSYEMAGTKHTRVEFGFNVIQTAKGNYDQEAKNRFMGLKVNEPVLERAFFKTYGMELKEIFSSFPLAVETFRFAVKQLFPELTKNAWRARNNAIMKLNPTAEKKSYQQKFNRKEYNKNFGRPGLKSILFSVVLVVIPKIGPTAG